MLNDELHVIDRTPGAPVVSLRVIPATPAPAPAVPSGGDPFSPYKILNHFERLAAAAAGHLVSPITVEIDPTNVCNHRCKWCVSIESHTGEVIDLPRFRTLIAELKSADVRSIVLKGGGEPTVHPHFIEMLDAVRESGLEAGLITNGSMPRRGSREKVLQTCEWVRVSLDAATPQTHRAIHGTSDFTRILQNVEYLTSNSTRTMIGLNFVAERRNYQEMVAFADLGKSLGCAYVTIRCVFDPTDALPDDIRAEMRQQALSAKALEDAAPDGFRVFLGNFTDRYLNAERAAPFPYPRCLGPNLVGIVGGDGHVYACCFLRGDKRFSFGSIHEQSFSEIWSGPRRQAVMNSVYRGECGRACAGGMTANRYNTYNEILNYLAAEEKKHVAFA
jgi:radical SAM protein with 4Fe4S-binding SPASM domain